MGGNGASSGFSVDKEGKPKNKYGTQYHTILKSGNIKFVSKNDRNSESLLETMTSGRVYVTVGGKDLLQVVYFDAQNKRSKTIDLNAEIMNSENGRVITVPAELVKVRTKASSTILVVCC